MLMLRVLEIKLIDLPAPCLRKSRGSGGRAPGDINEGRDLTLPLDYLLDGRFSPEYRGEGGPFGFAIALCVKFCDLSRCHANIIKIEPKRINSSQDSFK